MFWALIENITVWGALGWALISAVAVYVAMFALYKVNKEDLEGKEWFIWFFLNAVFGPIGVGICMAGSCIVLLFLAWDRVSAWLSKKFSHRTYGSLVYGWSLKIPRIKIERKED